MVWLLSAIESLGFEHVSHEMCWEHEHNELAERSRNYQNERRKDRYQERCQKMEYKLRERKKELKRLKRENEQVVEENRVLRTEVRERDGLVSKAIGETSDSSIRHAGFMMPKFSGTDPTNFAESWLKTIGNNASLFCWTEAQTFLVARLALEGDAKNWLLAQRRDINNWSDFQQAFAKRFRKKKTSVAKFHLAMAKRKLVKGEALRYYVSDMVYLGKRINLDEKDILEYIALGVPNELFAKFITDQFSCLADLEEYLDEVEGGESRDMTVFKKRCFNCRRIGHSYQECKMYQKMDVVGFLFIVMLMMYFGI